MGFNVAEDVEPLEYNFGSYGDGETHPIKEPSDKKTRRFFKNIAQEDRVARQAFADDVAPLDGETPEQTAARITADIEQHEQSQEDIAAASRRRVMEYLSEVCSGDPSVEQLEKLPERPFIEFFRYIRTELVPKG